MRAAAIEDGIVVNVIEVDSLEALPDVHLEYAETAAVGDRWSAGEFSKPPAPPPPVPQTVTSRQAIQALIKRGLDDDVDAALAAIADPVQRKLMRAEYDKSQVFERDRPLVIQIGAAIGLDAAGLDDLFSFASTL